MQVPNEGIAGAAMAFVGWCAWVTRAVFGNEKKIERVSGKLDLLLDYHGIKEKEDEPAK